MYVLFSHYFLFLVRKKIEWTPQEDSIINELQAKYGNKWTKITNEMVTTTKIIRTRAQVSVRWGLLDSGLLDSDVAEDSGVEMAEDSIRDEAKRGKKAGKARAAPFKKKGGKKSKRAAADSDSLVPPLPPPLSVDSTIQPVSVTDAPKGFAEV